MNSWTVHKCHKLTNKSSTLDGSSPVFIVRLLTVMFAGLSACLMPASTCKIHQRINTINSTIIMVSVSCTIIF